MKRIFSIAIPVIIILAGIIIFSISLNKCSEGEAIKMTRVDSLEIVNAQLKKDIRIEKIAKDSLEKIAAKKDSIRIEYKIKYYKDKSSIGDIQNLPCDSAKKLLIIVVNDCDSIINADSLYIKDLQGVIAIDNTIISKQDSVIKNDSIAKRTLKAENATLKKKVKSERNQKRIGWGAAALATFIAFFK